MVVGGRTRPILASSLQIGRAVHVGPLEVRSQPMKSARARTVLYIYYIVGTNSRQIIGGKQFTCGWSCRVVGCGNQVHSGHPNFWEGSREGGQNRVWLRGFGYHSIA